MIYWPDSQLGTFFLISFNSPNFTAQNVSVFNPVLQVTSLITGGNIQRTQVTYLRSHSWRLMKSLKSRL